jgi:hypothetical protein
LFPTDEPAAAPAHSHNGGVLLQLSTDDRVDSDDVDDDLSPQRGGMHDRLTVLLTKLLRWQMRARRLHLTEP